MFLEQSGSSMTLLIVLLCLLALVIVTVAVVITVYRKKHGKNAHIKSAAAMEEGQDLVPNTTTVVVTSPSQN
jgi:hypothetical protein